MTEPFFLQRQHVAVKIEGTEGTDAVPTDSDVIHPAYAIEYKADVEMKPREVVQASFSRPSQEAGERMATVTFGTELKGSGTAGTVPPNLSTPFRGSAMGETIVGGISVTYAPVSVGVESATVEVREGSTTAAGAKSKKIVGAKGTWEIVAVKGDKVLVNFTFTGRYIEPTEATQFTTPVITPDPIDFLGAGISFLGVGDHLIQNLSMNIANNVVMRNDANQASGNFAAAITGRDPTGAIDPEQRDITNENFYNEWTSGTEGVLSFALTGAAGNITNVSAPKAQILDTGEADRDGIRTSPLDLSLNQSVQAGDDEISIVFT